MSTITITLLSNFQVHRQVTNNTHLMALFPDYPDDPVPER